MSGFPTSLERALVLTSCNLIGGGFVPVLGGGLSDPAPMTAPVPFRMN